jgi:hypothetical protein
MPSSPRKRGAQPGNRNASRANRQAKSPTGSTPLSPDIARLVDLGIEFLTETILNLQQACREEAEQMTREDKRQMMKAASYAATAIERLLRAKMLQQSENQESLSDYINKALDEMNAELEADIARKKLYHPAPSPYTPLAVSPGLS